MRASRRILAFCALTTVLPLYEPSAAVLRTVTVEGTTVFSQREVLSWLASKPSVPFSTDVLEADLRAIREQYRLRGYLLARAALHTADYTSDSAWVDITLVIEEGRQTIIGAIRIEGTAALSGAEVRAGFDTRPGEPLDEQRLEQDIDLLIGRYESLGYPLATCSVTSIEMVPGPETDTLHVTLGVEEGQRIAIDEIRVRGVRETDTSVVVRETRITPGELYNPAKVSAIRQRLVRLNIFSSVAEPQLYLRDGTSGLLIAVTEGSTNTFDGVLGYIPAPAEGGSGYLTGLVAVGMRNLFGTGRKLSVRWQREDRYSQELGVRYVEPWIASFPVNVGIGFNQRQQDTSYVRRIVDLRAEVMLSEEVSASLVLGTEQVIPSADSADARVDRSSTRSIGAELLSDSRDDIYSPTAGGRYRVDYHYGKKTIGSDAASVQRFTFDVETFLPTFARQIAAIGLHGRDLEGGRIEEGDLYRYGGANSVRGYRENQFLASRVAWVNNEYRFLLARRTFLFGFVDLSYSYRPPDERHGVSASEAFRYGYGVGVRLDTALGNLGVSIALGKGDTFSDAKVHIGIINEF
jgi:outer membrane protein assembly factor BamA